MFVGIYFVYAQNLGIIWTWCSDIN